MLRARGGAQGEHARVIEQRGSLLSVMYMTLSRLPRCLASSRRDSFPARAAWGACSENDCLNFHRTQSQPLHQKFGNYPVDDLCGIGVYTREGKREGEEKRENVCHSVHAHQ